MESCSESQSSDFDELCEKMKELTRSSSNDVSKSDVGHESPILKKNSMRLDNDLLFTDIKMDNNVMRGKLEEMQEISAENLLLQSDLADYQAELSELRLETKQLRSRCHQLAENNHQNQAEIRDLRRYIELLKANKGGDSRQDLLNKIEYYQMEHERLLDEIRRLNLRLCKISPPISPKSNLRPIENKNNNLKLETQRESGCRSPVANAMAASSASSLAACRLLKDRSLSPTAALNYRNLTMDRYKQHMEGEESQSIHSDDTDDLLEPSIETTDKHDKENSRRYHDDRECNKSIRGSNQSGLLSGSDEFSLKTINDSKTEKTGTNLCSITNLTPQDSSTPNQSSGKKRRSSNFSNKSQCSSTSNKSLPRRAFAPRSPADLTVDAHSIKFTRPGGKICKGIVKFVGHLSSVNEIYVGVEVDDGDGEHSGTFRGTKYFSCADNKGMFTPFGKIVMAWE